MQDLYANLGSLPFVTGRTLVCDWKFEHAKVNTMYMYQGNISSRFSSNLKY